MYYRSIFTRSILLFSFLVVFLWHLDAAEQSSPILINPKDSRMAELYIAFLDRDIKEALKQFNPQKGLLEIGNPQETTAETIELNPLAYDKRRSLANNPNYLISYRQSRLTASLAGGMAYAYSFKKSDYYKDPQILNHIKAIFNTFGANQAETGEFVFTPIHYCSVWGTHEMAWRLEPLICAYDIIQSDLSPEERGKFKSILDKGMEFLLKNEQSSMTNRGMVWCGVMSLCYRFTGEEKYYREAQRVFHWVKRIFAGSGEIREGPGPDLGYSTISLQYLFLYRLMTGNEELDDLLTRSLKWYTRLFTFHAVPLEGMSTRQWLTEGSRVARILGALTFYADQNPEFAQIATRYLEAFIDSPGGFSLDHGGGYFLRGAEYHKRPDDLKDIPYEPYEQLYKSDHALYFLIGRNYQTAVTLRGRKPLKGLQTWSYKGQKPIIFPSKAIQSKVVGFGYDSSLMDVSWEQKPAYNLTSLDDGIQVLSYSQGELITAYIFSNDTTTVIFRSKSGGGRVELAHHLPSCAEIDQPRQKIITFRDSNAQILLPNITPSAQVILETLRIYFEFETEFCWYTLGGPQSSVTLIPVQEGLILAQIAEMDLKKSIIVNLSQEPFTKETTFPGTSIQIPPLFPYGASILE